jgi:DNA-binding PadR family transcriptional regulator
MREFWDVSFMGRQPPHGGRWQRGFWAELFGDPPPRADRGAVRWLVLAAIEERARHGYEVIQAITERTGGSYRPSPGVVYPTLQMLEELGHARSTESDGRRTYTITADGRRELEEHREEVEDFYDRSGGEAWEDYAEDLAELGKHVARTMRAFKRAARRGHVGAGTLKKVRAIVEKALKDIEAVVDGR